MSSKSAVSSRQIEQQAMIDYHGSRMEFLRRQLDNPASRAVAATTALRGSDH